MHAVDRLVVWTCVGVGMLAGCALIERPGARPAALTMQAPAPTTPPVAQRWIRIRKREHRLVLYEGNEVIRTYPVVFGKDPVWSKLYQGDHRTPEGEYHISNKYYHPYWSRFLMLDYPTAYNEEIYAWSREHGLLPVRGHAVPGIGGAVGIHGTEDEGLNRRGINWTEGCISLLNDDVDELYDLVPVGTKVVIER